jgi:C1A family cysteine protease
MADKKSARRYGWHRDLPDHRDKVYSVMRVAGPLPPAVDLRPTCPPIYDQGELGSCTGNAIAGAYAFTKYKETTNPTGFITPSRLFIYYNERAREGTIDQDAGAQIRDGIKVIATLGVCMEATWPYVISQFKKRPSKAAFAEAKKNEALTYSRVPQIADAIKGCLASGYPVIFGFSVYESFEGADVASTGILNMPQPDEQMMGGHAVLCVGYTSTQQYIVRNSWGSGWGQQGYFLMPEAYMENPNLASDFWTIRTVE